MSLLGLLYQFEKRGSCWFFEGSHRVLSKDRFCSRLDVLFREPGHSGFACYTTHICVWSTVTLLLLIGQEAELSSPLEQPEGVLRPLADLAFNVLELALKIVDLRGDVIKIIRALDVGRVYGIEFFLQLLPNLKSIQNVHIMTYGRDVRGDLRQGLSNLRDRPLLRVRANPKSAKVNGSGNRILNKLWVAHRGFNLPLKF